MSRLIPMALLFIAAPVFAQDPTDGIDLMSIVGALMGSVKVPVLAMLTVVALALHRIQAITAAWAIVIPLAIGAALGVLSALVTAQTATGGWVPVPQLLLSIIEGAAVNGGMAVIVGRLASIGFDKLWRAEAPPPS